MRTCSQHIFIMGSRTTPTDCGVATALVCVCFLFERPASWRLLVHLVRINGRRPILLLRGVPGQQILGSSRFTVQGNSSALRYGPHSSQSRIQCEEDEESVFVLRRQPGATFRYSHCRSRLPSRPESLTSEGTAKIRRISREILELMPRDRTYHRACVMAHRQSDLEDGGLDRDPIDATTV